MKREFELYERHFNLLDKVIDRISDVTKSKPLSRSKTAIFAMLPRLIGTMQSIRILTLKGYYYDVRILERSLFENLGLCVYLARNQQEATNWLQGKDISIPKIKLSSEFLSFLTKEKEKFEKMGKAEYGKLSDYIHTSIRAIVPSFVTRIERSRAELQFPPFFNKQKVSYLEAYPMVLLCILRVVFNDELGEKWMEKIWDTLTEYTSLY